MFKKQRNTIEDADDESKIQESNNHDCAFPIVDRQESEIQILKEEIETLNQKISHLQNENEDLHSENIALKDENTSLKKDYNCYNDLFLKSGKKNVPYF